MLGRGENASGPMEANDKDRKTESKVRNEKGATERVHRRDKELSHQKQKSTELHKTATKALSFSSC